MITKFKIYESLNRKLKIGDYVVTGEEIIGAYDNTHILPYEIGQLTSIVSTHYWFNFKCGEVCLKPERILYWSENKAELEAELSSKKFNL